MTVATHKTTGNGTTGANMRGTFHADKNSEVATGILYAGGGGTTETGWQINSLTSPNGANAALRYVTRDSYAFRFFTFAVDWTWGNDTIITRISDAYDEAIANRLFSSGDVHLMAASMGAPCVLNWAAQNSAKVASLSLFIPAVDMQDIETNNRVTPYPIIPQPSTAYGGSPVPDDHNPADNTSDYVDFPIKIWYSNDDTICVRSVVEAFGAAVGAEMVNLGDRIPYQSAFAIPGHDLGNLDGQQVAQWVAFHDVVSHVLAEPASFVHTAGRGQ